MKYKLLLLVATIIATNIEPLTAAYMGGGTPPPLPRRPGEAPVGVPPPLPARPGQAPAGPQAPVVPPPLPSRPAAPRGPTPEQDIAQLRNVNADLTKRLTNSVKEVQALRIEVANLRKTAGAPMPANASPEDLNKMVYDAMRKVAKASDDAGYPEARDAYSDAANEIGVEGLFRTR